eukprot:14464817-Ditylum_brightwellii.AAC.1
MSEFPIACRSNTDILGEMSNQEKELDQRVADKESTFDMSTREKWRNQEAGRTGSIHESMQQKGALAVDESLVGMCIEYLSQFDMDDAGSTITLRRCSGKVERICDGTWILAGA